MKTRKKLLHSTLILALALGQTSGTVVEAVSMLSSVESIDVKKISKMKTIKTYVPTLLSVCRTTAV